MSSLIYLLTIALFILGLAVILFYWLIRHNQFNDPDKHKSMIFFEDDDN